MRAQFGPAHNSFEDCPFNRLSIISWLGVVGFDPVTPGSKAGTVVAWRHSPVQQRRCSPYGAWAPGPCQDL